MPKLYSENVSSYTDINYRTYSFYYTDNPFIYMINYRTYSFYYLLKILAACPRGRYGYNCQENCGVNCGVPERCDRVTGQCEGGCQVGWKGTTCESG